MSFQVTQEDTPRRYAARKRPLLRGSILETYWEDIEGEPGWQQQVGLLSVWCPYCGRFHAHGWSLDLDARYAEHRTAHCGEGSPFHPAGYWIAPLPQRHLAAAHVVKLGRPQRRFLVTRERRILAQQHEARLREARLWGAAS